MNRNAGGGSKKFPLLETIHFRRAISTLFEWVCTSLHPDCYLANTDAGLPTIPEIGQVDSEADGKSCLAGCAQLLLSYFIEIRGQSAADRGRWVERTRLTITGVGASIPPHSNLTDISDSDCDTEDRRTPWQSQKRRRDFRRTKNKFRTTHSERR